MICMIPDSLPDARIALSAGMRRSTEDNLVWESWLKPEAAKKIRRFLDTEPEKAFEQDTWDILLLADTHLEQPENIRTVRREADRGALVLLTGRLKKGCLTEQLYRNRICGAYGGDSADSDPEFDRDGRDKRDLDPAVPGCGSQR